MWGNAMTFRRHFQTLPDHSFVAFIHPCALAQILIELETALLDDIPHWYKLQTHDVSSIPLPQPSPYLPRRHIHKDSPSKKLQSTYSVCVCMRVLMCVRYREM